MRRANSLWIKIGLFFGLWLGLVCIEGICGEIASASLIAVNHSPVISSDGDGQHTTIHIPENEHAVTTLAGQDEGGGPLSYRLIPEALPTELAELQLWLDAADYHGDGSILANDSYLLRPWQDKSGNGHHYLIGHGNPTYQSNIINGRGVIELTADRYDPPVELTMQDEYTLFVVARTIGLSDERVLSSNLSDVHFGWWRGSQRTLFIEGTPSLIRGDSTAPTDTDAKLFSFVRHPDGALQGYDGGMLFAGSLASNNPPIRLMLGGGTHTNFLDELSDVQMAEVIIFSRALSDAEQAQIRSYLGRKWGFNDVVLDTAYFELDQESGTISFVAPPDYEAPTDFNRDNQYHLIAQVQEPQSDRLVSEDLQILSINVTDVDEPHYFVSYSGTHTVTLAYTAGLSLPVAQVTVRDPEESVIELSLSGADSTNFQLDRTTGYLSFLNVPDYNNPIDADVDNHYHVTVNATINPVVNAAINPSIDTTVTQSFLIQVIDNEHNQPPAQIIDSDQDTIPDSIEVTLGLNPTDADSDGDSLLDSVEVGINWYVPLNTDGDELINALDPDDDNDTIPTIIEVADGATDVVAGADVDQDGLPNWHDTESDGDGKEDESELTGDEDGDGIPNYLDASDIDGPLGDLDMDGLDNTTENQMGTSPYRADTDGDGLCDGKIGRVGICIAGEETHAPSGQGSLDTDGDGLINALDTDDDDDSLLTRVELEHSIEQNNMDVDLDGIPNWLDKDADGDRLVDRAEGLADDDNDMIPNFLDPTRIELPLQDNDNDGLTNQEENRLGTNPSAADSDGDQLSDATEIGDPMNPTDTDQDGLIDALDDDDDNDGILTSQEVADSQLPLISSDDVDGDGELNWLDVDSDGDNLEDGIDGQGDSEIAGIPSYLYLKHELIDFHFTANVTVLEDTDGNGLVSPGDILSYQIAVVNLGPVTAYNLQILDSIDSNLALIPSTVQTSQGVVRMDGQPEINQIVWEVNKLEVNRELRSTFHVLIRTNADSATIRHQAELQYSSNSNSSQRELLLSDDPNTEAVGDPTLLTLNNFTLNDSLIYLPMIK
ncbi:MAG: hypothetical protein AAF702_03850 [Chloroflexota bacterium]